MLVYYECYDFAISSSSLKYFYEREREKSEDIYTLFPEVGLSKASCKLYLTNHLTNIDEEMIVETSNFLK